MRRKDVTQHYQEMAGHIVELADVVETYSRASEAFSCALETAMAAGHPGLSARAGQILAARNQRELEINGDWAMVGRA